MIEQELKAIAIEHEEEQVKVVVLKDVEDPLLEALGIGRLQKGSEVPLQRGVARSLVREGIAEYAESRLRLEDLGRYAFLETRRGTAPNTLEKLPQTFYPDLRDYIEQLRRRSLERDPYAIEELHKAEAFIEDLVKTRLRKILLLVQAGEDAKEAYDAMTPEERVLFDAIRKLVDTWKKEILPVEV